MKCPKCGRSNREDAIYCGGCGTKLRNVSHSSLEDTKVDIEVPKPPEERPNYW